MLFNKEVTEETEMGSNHHSGTPFPLLPSVQISQETKAGTSRQNRTWSVFFLLGFEFKDLKTWNTGEFGAVMGGYR